MDKTALKPGDHFKATDKLGNTYSYYYLGKFLEAETDREFLLWNQSLHVFTSVEKEWAQERKIKVFRNDSIQFYVLCRFKRRMIHLWTMKTYISYLKVTREQGKQFGAYVDSMLSIYHIVTVIPCSGGDQQAFQKTSDYINRHLELLKYEISSTIKEQKPNKYLGRIL